MTDDRYRHSVLRLLYERGPLTRKQIMTCLNLRLNNLVAICNSLEAEGEIVRLPSPHIRNVPLTLNSRRFGIVGLEHAREQAVCVLLSVDGRKMAVEEFPLNGEEGGGARLERLLGILEEFLNRHRRISVVGIGFADIGIVDSVRGVGVYSAHIADWSEMEIGEALQRRFGLFNRIVDRTGASAFDRLRQEPQNPCVRDSLQIYVGGGVGATILQDGQYWGASTPSSCQLGHTIVNPHGAKCSCGNRGCLETEVSIPALVSRASTISHGAISTEKQFFAEAKRGSRTCVKLLMESGETLGIAIANVVTFTAITNVMLRSALCQAHPVFLASVERTVRENVILPFRAKVRVVANLQEEDGPATGAAFYTQREFFN